MTNNVAFVVIVAIDAILAIVAIITTVTTSLIVIIIIVVLQHCHACNSSCDALSIPSTRLFEGLAITAVIYFLTFTQFNNGGLSPNTLKPYPYDRPTFGLYFKIPCPKINYEFLLLLYVRIKELIMIFSFALCSLQYDHLRVTEPQAYI